jgi:hypothetical protein
MKNKIDPYQTQNIFSGVEYHFSLYDIVSEK